MLSVTLYLASLLRRGSKGFSVRKESPEKVNAGVKVGGMR